MKILDDSATIIIVGKWNRHILTPEWVSKNIFEHEEIEVQFPVNRPELAPKYKKHGENIIFLPAMHRIQFIASNPRDNDDLKTIPHYIRKITSTLEYTPVTAFGVNIAFEEKSELFEKLDLFNLSDSVSLMEKEYVSVATEIKRQFHINDCLLNFGAKYNQEFVYFDFNFHYSVTSAKEISDFMTENLIIDKKDKALEIMKDVYNLELENEEEEE